MKRLLGALLAMTLLGVLGAGCGSSRSSAVMGENVNIADEDRQYMQPMAGADGSTIRKSGEPKTFMHPRSERFWRGAEAFVYGNWLKQKF